MSTVSVSNGTVQVPGAQLYYEVRGTGPLLVMVGNPMDANPFDALRTGSTKIVVGIGEKSTGQLCDRTSTALAAAIGVRRTHFPGGHVGFVENPDAFAARLRAALRQA